MCAATRLYLSKCDREVIPELDGDSSNGHLHSEESGPGADHNVAKVLAPAIDDMLLRRCKKRNVRIMREEERERSKRKTTYRFVGVLLNNCDDRTFT